MLPPTDFGPFANRLHKMARHYGKWARRQGLSCYRIYDADIPEFPVIVDAYGEHLYVAEYYRAKLQEDEAAYRLWRRELRATITEVLGIGGEKLHFKLRQRQKGKQQYQKAEAHGRDLVVTENGLKFWVNLDDYLDTGLFLDHRNLRQRVRQEAEAKRVLNLFAYTGSFTVYAAAGGARSSLTIDLSNTYLEWGRRNLELNELYGKTHEFLRADVKAWLAEPVARQFDIIILDPPTFSNSKRMDKVLDTQRDHPMLINACLARLRPGGVLYFSTNYRRFKLQEEHLHPNSIQKEISRQTVPPDFRKQPHRAWEIRWKEE
ncbi:MAG: SAM-dependent methyltransferase [Bacteroidetes bacterium]|nr:MAG: SAM-dependent methyltransferase [Bacteroidota bacterium]